jgi:hypothetical protein
MGWIQLRRSRLTGWLIGALLLMQFAVAAHACLVGSVDAQAAMQMTAMADCEGAMPAGLDPGQPLCKAHCEQGSQAFNPALTFDAPAASLLLAVLDWADAIVPADMPPRAPHGVASGDPPSGAPPLYLSLLVLRN